MHALLPQLPGLPIPDALAARSGCSCMGARGSIAGITVPKDEGRKERWYFYSVTCRLHGVAAKEKLTLEEPITL